MTLSILSIYFENSQDVPVPPDQVRRRGSQTTAEALCEEVKNVKYGHLAAMSSRGIDLELRQGTGGNEG